MLGQIEEMGWHPEHVGYVSVETGEIARAKVMSSGSVTYAGLRGGDLVPSAVVSSCRSW